MNKTPFVDFKHIETREELEEYQVYLTEAISRNEYPVYGKPAYEKEAPLIVFGNNGEKLKTNNEYFITDLGQIKQYKKDGTERKKPPNKGLDSKIILENGKSMSRKTYTLQLWSFYPHLNWKPFCEGKSEVDHILQKHEKCHFGFLEAVNHKENMNRHSFTDKCEEGFIKRKDMTGKPFDIYKNGECIIQNCVSGKDGSNKLKEFDGVDVHASRFSCCLQGNIKSFHKKIYTAKYTDAFKQSQEDLPDEIWKCEDEWCQKTKILQKFENIKGSAPSAISNKGRVQNWCGIKHRGSDTQEREKPRFWRHTNIALLVHLAFSYEEVGDRMILHKDGEEEHPDVYVYDGEGNRRYSNVFGTFYLGTGQQNMADIGGAKKRVAESNPENLFTVWDKFSGEMIGSYSYVPDCEKDLNERFGKMKAWHINDCLKGTQRSSNGFIFKYGTKSGLRRFVVKNYETNEILGTYVDIPQVRNKLQEEHEGKGFGSIYNILNKKRNVKVIHGYTFEYIE